MASFFDKVKKGVSDTNTKTKILIETNKLKSQISKEENRIQGFYRDIGRQVYDSYDKKDMSNLVDLVDDNCSQIAIIQDEIKKLGLKIEELNETPEEPAPTPPVPSTEESVPTPVISKEIEELEIKAEIIEEEIEAETAKMVEEIETQIEKVVEEVEIEDEETLKESIVLEEEMVSQKQCSNCNTQIHDDSKFCIHCGSPVLEEKPADIVEENKCPSCNEEFQLGAKFCINCGTSL